MNGLRHLRVLCVFFVFIAACGPESEEEHVRKFMKDLTVSAEKKELSDLMKSFAPEYSDAEGRDKAATESLIGSYFQRYRGIVIHILSTRVDNFEPDGRIQVQVEVMISSGAAEVFRKLIRYAGEYYRFQLRLRKEEPRRWLIESADWTSLPVGELFPESLDILRKLFPDG